MGVALAQREPPGDVEGEAGQDMSLANLVQARRKIKKKVRRVERGREEPTGLGAGGFTHVAKEEKTVAVTINVSACKGPMLECLSDVLSKQPQFVVSDDSSRNKDDVYFISTRENLAKRIKNLSRKSLVSKFPGMFQTCSNQTFAREMSLALKLLPAATSSNAKLWPETFVLPDDMKDVKEAMVRAQADYKEKRCKNVPAWIIKPELRGENGGMPLDQIYIVTKLEELEKKMSMQGHNRSNWICQRYIQEPMLLDGLKFDCRAYVVVRSLDPLEFYLAKEGMTRFCTEPFAPITGGKYETLAHISSFHLNKASPNYKNAGQQSLNEDSTSSKRTLTTVLQQIRRRARDDNIAEISQTKFFESLQPMIGTAVTSMLPVLRASYCRQFGIGHEDLLGKPCQAFQLIAFDFVLQEDMTPILIQASNQPGLSITQIMPNRAGEMLNERSAVDHSVKTRILAGALRTITEPKISQEAVNDAEVEGEYVDKKPDKKGKVARSAGAGRLRFITVGLDFYAPLEKCYKLIDQMYLKCGGRRKAFQPAVLKRVLAEVPHVFHKKFTKPDLTILAANYRGMTRQVKESSSDLGMVDDLAIVDFARLLLQISCKSSGSDQHPLVRVIMMLEQVFPTVAPPADPAKEQNTVRSDGDGGADPAQAASQAEDEVIADGDDIGTLSNTNSANADDETNAAFPGSAGEGGELGLNLSNVPPPKTATSPRAAVRGGSAVSVASSLGLGDDDGDAEPSAETIASRLDAVAMKKERDALAEAQHAMEQNMVGYMESDADQEARIMQLEKRVSTLSELICVLLPHAKARFASEDGAIKEVLEQKKQEQAAQMDAVREQNKERKKNLSKQKQLRQAIRQKQKAAMSNAKAAGEASMAADDDGDDPGDLKLRRRRSTTNKLNSGSKGVPLKLPSLTSGGKVKKNNSRGKQNRGRT